MLAAVPDGAATAEPVTSAAAEPTEEIVSLSQLAAFPVEEFHVYETARQQLIVRCMSDRGLDYSMPTVDPTSNLDALAELYPADDLLQQYGYTWRLYSAAFTPPNDEANAKSMQDPVFEAAFNQCGESAAGVLDIRPFAEAAQVIDNARQELSTQVESDPRYIEHLDLWSQCLLARGYPGFAGPVEAMRSVTLDPVSATAIQLALADYACQREVGLAESARAILSELSREWINQNPGAIAALESALDALVGSAQVLLDSAAGG